jgi:hypothetical protein
MARPVCKWPWLVRSELSRLRQRIRPIGDAVAKMEICALRSVQHGPITIMMALVAVCLLVRLL